MHSNLQSSANANGEPADTLAPHLFRPLFYVPWGHADCQFAVLLDDFEAINQLSSTLDSSIEEICLGLCPKTQCFGPGFSTNGVDLHQLFHPTQAPEMERDDDISMSLLQEELPILLFTRFKLDAFAQVGFGLLFQEAIYQAIDVVMQKTVVHLLEKTRNTDCGAKLQISSDDVTSFKISVVDLLGSEELGTLIFCRNASVGMSLVGALRQLTYKELFNSEAGERLKTAIQNSTVFHSLLQIQSEPIAPTVDCILDNHVFRWTHTTMSIAPAAFFSQSAKSVSRCAGLISGLVELQIPPGHDVTVVSELNRQNTVAEPEVLPEGVSLIEIGRADLVTDLRNQRAFTSVKLRDAIGMTLNRRKAFGTLANVDHGRNVVDSFTTLIVPTILPELPEPLAGSVHHTPLFSRALQQIQRRLCYPERLLPNEQKGPQNTAGRLSLSRLRQIPRSYGLPVTLRRNIECLFQNFAIHIGDYFVFDCVLDLYDAFATLHLALTDQLFALRREEIRNYKGVSIPPLDAERVLHITNFVDALQNALSHRLANCFSEPMSRDMAIDMRGGLNQVIAAADVPLKCGLGLLRNFVMTAKGDKCRRESVGGITKISMRPGMRSMEVPLGIERDAQLCFVEADVPHILHVGSFSDYLHEAAHLIFAGILTRQPNSLIGSLSADSRNIGRPQTNVVDRIEAEHQLERLNEIFAHLMVRLLVFRDRDDKRSRRREFLLHHLIANEKARSGLEANDHEVIVCTTELLIRLCIVECLVPPFDKKNWSEVQFRNSLHEAISRRNAIEQVIEDSLVALPERERLWSSPFAEGWQYAVGEFEKVYIKLLPFLPDLWSWVTSVIHPFRQELGGLDTLWMQGTLSRFISECLHDGAPLSRLGYSKSDIQPLSRDQDTNGVDCLMLTCAILSEYVSRAPIDEKAELFLHRNRRTGLVEFPNIPRKWATFLVDPGSAVMFSTDPVNRGQRLVQQIAVQKTLWDMATNLRARRLHNVIHENWGPFPVKQQ
ncbi:MAG: hypothetical protein U0996_21885 [Planctomycetaceae bacterium]